jgi:putative inorganic carbon (HCO3(-)) transporter
MICSFGAAGAPAMRSAPAVSILRILVVGYVALLPYLFEIGPRLNFAPADCFLILVLVLAAAHLRFRRSAWTIWHVGMLFTFAFGSLVAAVSFGELDRYELLNKDAGLLLPFLSYAAITSVVTNWEDLRHVLRVFTVSVVAENLLAIGGFMAAYFFHVATPFTRYEGLRLSGMLLDPNAYGGLLVVALVICESASWGQTPLFQRPMLWFSRITLDLGILFTFSRTAWLGLGLAFLLFFAIKPLVAVRPLLAAIAASPCLVFLMGRQFLPVFEEMASRPKQVQQRFDLIHQALQAFTRHPLLGGGLGSFRLAVGEVAHNSVMWFLADFGMLGVTAFVAFLGWFLTTAWSAYRFAPQNQQPVALALFLAHAAMIGVAMGIEAFYQRHWWLVLGLIGSAHSLSPDRWAIARLRWNPSLVFAHRETHAHL